MQIIAPRKQRTRQHVIADLSVHHVEGFILEEGHVAQRLGSDYGYDLMAWTFDEDGFIEPGMIFFQCKATESLRPIGGEFVFDLDVRDLNLWIREEPPVVLILFDATIRRGFWLAIQQYFQEDELRLPKRGAKTVRVRVSMEQRFDRKAVGKLRELKREAQRWHK